MVCWKGPRLIGTVSKPFYAILVQMEHTVRLEVLAARLDKLDSNELEAM